MSRNYSLFNRLRTSHLLWQKHITTKPSKNFSADLLRATNDSSKAIRPLFLGFMVVMTYIVVIIAGLEDIDFLIGSGAKLPIIDTQVPFKGFFTFTPVLLVVYHFQVLIQLSILGRTAVRFRRRIDRIEKDKRRLANEADSFMLSYFIAGPEKGIFRILLIFPLLFTLVIAPPILLAYIQASFIPFQNEAITWWHRIFLSLDLMLIIYFLPKTFHVIGTLPLPLRASVMLARRKKHNAAMNTIIFLLVIPLITFSFFSALIPGEPLELVLAGEDNTKIGKFVELPLTRLLFFSLGAEQRRRSADNCIDQAEFRFFHRNIDVCRHVVVKNLTKPDRRGDLLSYDPTALPYIEGVTLVSRNLRYANFFSSALPLANFSDSDLRGASFVGADLRYSSFSGADLRGARFAKAMLTGALLNSGMNGNLSGANFDGATLTCANFSGSASANKASFENAIAPGADFTGINLQGASFRNAILYGSDFTVATIDMKTDFSGARISGVDFRGLNFTKGTQEKIIHDFIQNLGKSGGAIYPDDDPAKIFEPNNKDTKIAYDIRDIKTQKHNLDYDGNGGIVSECREKLKKLNIKIYPD